MARIAAHAVAHAQRQQKELAKNAPPAGCGGLLVDGFDAGIATPDSLVGHLIRASRDGLSSYASCRSMMDCLRSECGVEKINEYHLAALLGNAARRGNYSAFLRHANARGDAALGAGIVAALRRSGTLPDHALFDQLVAFHGRAGQWPAATCGHLLCADAHSEPAGYDGIKPAGAIAAAARASPASRIWTALAHALGRRAEAGAVVAPSCALLDGEPLRADAMPPGLRDLALVGVRPPDPGMVVVLAVLHPACTLSDAQLGTIRENARVCLARNGYAVPEKAGVAEMAALLKAAKKARRAEGRGTGGSGSGKGNGGGKGSEDGARKDGRG
ncbi:hypothetical protein DFJ74DRAFT_748973 [Hyaloraphidium curvatum]|nr:hypothetical protein DFJ74DRAFT_748973 [Hyaloraphidium curvatum]